MGPKRRTLTTCAIVTALLILAAPALAQTPKATAVAVNPTTVTFTPSADHDATLSDGTALVASYALRLFMAGATEPVQTYDLGKPTPTNGAIEVQNPAWFTALALKKEAFARIVAIGVGGEAASEASNPFVMVGPPGPPGKPTASKK